MRRVISPKIRLFLENLYAEGVYGSSAEAARRAGYRNPEVEGPRLRRKYNDLCERARDTFVGTKHVGYDEAMALLGKVARNPEHREQVRAISMLLELHGAKSAVDPAALRGEIAQLLKSLAQHKAAAALSPAPVVVDVTPETPST